MAEIENYKKVKGSKIIFYGLITQQLIIMYVNMYIFFNICVHTHTHVDSLR